MVVGLGSGRASEMAIQYLGRQIRTGAFKDIVGIPMTLTSANEAAKAGIPLNYHQDNAQIDFAFDDADVIEEGTLAAIVRRQSSDGEESHCKKSLCSRQARKWYSRSRRISTVVVWKLGSLETAEEIDDLFLGDAEVWRRTVLGHAGPLGGDFPFVTKEGHNVLDLIFTSLISSLVEVADGLDKVDGVVEHGVVSKIPCTAIVASESGMCIIEYLEGL